jgi:4-amino-4-deoxy-L-arabinose transferase-like glycosyltransferase
MKSISDRLALILSLAAVLMAYMAADLVFERVPHLEDEMAYVWQAEAAAKGQLSIPSPPLAKSVFTPFVVDYEGQRFGKYPPGWPVLLALGVLAGGRAWVNPLLAGLAVWLTYRLGQKIFDQRIALLAAFLTLTSPFFLLNSGSLLSHPWSLALSLTLALVWLDLFLQDAAPPVPAWMLTGVAGLSLGLLALTRPLTALGVGLPFFVHGLVLLWRGAPQTRRRVLVIGLLALAVAALIPLWQFAVTGDPLLNPYTLWWKYDKVGFGEGFGRQEGGHSLYWAWVNLRNSLKAGQADLFGWGRISWHLACGRFGTTGALGLRRASSLPWRWSTWPTGSAPRSTDRAITMKVCTA